MNLREWRKSKEFTQEELGRKLGLGDQWKTYQSYETGRTEPPQSIKDKLKGMGYKWGPEISPHVTPGFPEKEIIQATEMVYQFIGAGHLSPVKMGNFISTVAELLVRGHQPEEIRDRVAPVIRDLAHSAALPPGSNP
jgi:transcriptional regulator with XRE-family HTH domain